MTSFFSRYFVVFAPAFFDRVMAKTVFSQLLFCWFLAGKGGVMFMFDVM